MIGEALPRPGMSAVQRMFFVALQSIGGSALGATPVASGPRQAGQSALSSAKVASDATHARRAKTASVVTLISISVARCADKTAAHSEAPANLLRRLWRRHAGSQYEAPATRRRRDGRRFARATCSFDESARPESKDTRSVNGPQPPPAAFLRWTAAAPGCISEMEGSRPRLHFPNPKRQRAGIEPASPLREESRVGALALRRDRPEAGPQPRQPSHPNPPTLAQPG